MGKNKEKPFQRICKTCSKKFFRQGIRNWHCADCLAKKRKDNYIKLKNYLGFK